MATIKQVTQGNEFKSQTHTVTLPNGARLTRRVNYAKQSCFTTEEMSKIATALGIVSIAAAVAHLRNKGVTITLGADYQFAKNHANKMLRLIWESAPKSATAETYTPKVGFEQAIKTILGSRVLKSSYTAVEVKKFSDGGILTQMFTAVAPKPKLQLPRINGYDGKVTGKNIVYGCASLPLAWFAIPNGGTRQIQSLVLSSGVSVNETQVSAIYAYLKENKL